MTGATNDPGPTGLVCVLVAGARAPLAALETLSPSRDALPTALTELRRRAGVDQVLLVTTCERMELYAYDAGGPDPQALMTALAQVRGVPAAAVHAAVDVLEGRDAARHLLRVASGLESFVLGESDVVGQVRAAAAAARQLGVQGLELERLVAAAVNTSRRVRGSTTFCESGRSVAAAALDIAAAEAPHGLHGSRVVVVGGGDVAIQAVASATSHGARVTVCARTRRRAARIEEAGARVVPLDRLPDLLPTADVVVFATASPEPLLEAAHVRRSLGGTGHRVLLLDLCVPRNVHPDVRDAAEVRLLDLTDLRRMTSTEDERFTHDVTRATQVVEEELDRYQRWMARRVAAASMQRLRADLDACIQAQTDAATHGVPEELRPLVAESIRRGLHQLAHGPTRRLTEAAEAGDHRLVQLLGGIFAEA